MNSMQPKFTEEEKKKYLLKNYMAFLIAIIGVPDKGDWAKKEKFGIKKDGRIYLRTSKSLNMMGIKAEKEIER